MVVNDDAGELDERGALESIASRLAPTVSMSRECVKNPKKGRPSGRPNVLLRL
ncbi:UNVERIFIED_ORG: hypothetical protein J2Y84_003070 [Pseudomonas reinekei]|nr:hypothetical protein [Pseudomonas reinekei]